MAVDSRGSRVPAGASGPSSDRTTARCAGTMAAARTTAATAVSPAETSTQDWVSTPSRTAVATPNTGIVTPTTA